VAGCWYESFVGGRGCCGCAGSTPTLRRSSSCSDIHARANEHLPMTLYLHCGQVEDTKGNNGKSGRLIVTNLRVIWCVCLSACLSVPPATAAYWPDFQHLLQSASNIFSFMTVTVSDVAVPVGRPENQTVCSRVDSILETAFAAVP
jgi:hypothetical protein